MLHASSTTKVEVEQTHRAMDRMAGSCGRLMESVDEMAEAVQRGGRLLVELADALDDLLAAAWLRASSTEPA